MAENTIAQEKHGEMAKTDLIGGLSNIAQKPSDLADQQSRSNQHITVRGSRWSLSEAALWKSR